MEQPEAFKGSLLYAKPMDDWNRSSFWNDPFHPMRSHARNTMRRKPQCVGQTALF